MNEAGHLRDEYPYIIIKVTHIQKPALFGGVVEKTAIQYRDHSGSLQGTIEECYADGHIPPEWCNPALIRYIRGTEWRR